MKAPARLSESAYRGGRTRPNCYRQGQSRRQRRRSLRQQGLEGADIDGFNQVMVEAGGGRVLAVLVASVPAERYEQHLIEARLGSQPPSDRVAVHSGQADVH